jgi:hyaluronoglucosaminidase
MATMTGYVEGYYGRLLDWADRRRILDALADGGMNVYVYAPKDDPFHRQQWRRSYDAEWLAEFASFAAAAATRQVQLVAGIAPGLDFDFASMSEDAVGETDLALLLGKAHALVAAGADRIALLMDDIDADFAGRCGAFTSEGAAHAALANRLGDDLGAPIMVVPRIYADSLVTAEDTQSLTYLGDFAASLHPMHTPVYCGDDIVARHTGGDASGRLDPSRVIVWDNFYANDYCPRRLFLGPWRDRGARQNLLLNPTGLIETDLLLLAVMAASRDADSDGDRLLRWRRVMAAHGVPDPFEKVAAYFDAPFGFAPAVSVADDGAVRAALEHLLWRWKSPLQREWYPALMGLKQDIGIADGSLPPLRIGKTQLVPLARRLGGLHDGA